MNYNRNFNHSTIQRFIFHFQFPCGIIYNCIQMATTGNKLIDKFQYNQNKTVRDGDVQIITANHTVLKSLNTLKKINVKATGELTRYKSILNEIQILKHLPVSEKYIKCHKMLRTSNNIYIVYDHIGQNRTLKQFIQENPKLSEADRFEIINKIIKCLIQFRKFKVAHAFFNTKNIEINFNHQIKFVNFQHAFDTQKKQLLSQQHFSSILGSDLTPPEIKKLTSEQASIDLLQTADVFCFGNIVLQMIKKSRVSKGKANNSLTLEEDFQRRRQAELLDFALKCTSQNKDIRYSLKEVQQFFQKKVVSLKLVSSRSALQQSQHSSFSSSKSNNNLAISQPYNCRKQRKDSGQDSKSIKSSNQNILKTILSSSNTKTKQSSVNNSKIEEIKVKIFGQLMNQLIQKRNLSLFLLQLAKIFLNLPAVDQQTKIIAAFLHLKKSGMIICQLAKTIQKTQFKTQTSQKQKRQFTRSAEFLKLSHFIKKQMNLNKRIIQQVVGLLQQNVSSILKQNRSFKMQCQSQNINCLYLRQIIIKYVQNVIQKVNYCHSWKVKTSRKKSTDKSLSKSPSNLKIQTKLSQRQLESPNLNFISRHTNLLDVQSNYLEVCSTRSIGMSSRSIQTSRDSQIQDYEDQTVKKIIDRHQLQYLSLACNILKYQTYEQVFQKMVHRQKVYSRDQFVVDQYRSKQVAELMADLKIILRENK